MNLTLYYYLQNTILFTIISFHLNIITTFISKRYEAKFAMEKEKSTEVLHPLKTEVIELDEQIGGMKNQISSMKANIARNEEKLQQLMKLMSSS